MTEKAPTRQEIEKTIGSSSHFQFPIEPYKELLGNVAESIDYAESEGMKDLFLYMPILEVL